MVHLFKIIKKPAGWIMIAIILIVVITGIILLSAQNDPSTLDGFTAALNRQLGNVIDVTKQEYQKAEGSVNERQRMLRVDTENIFVELADDQTLAKIVDDRLDRITSPFIDWIGPVHLHVKDNLIVMYVGKNEKILDALVKLLGAELPHI